MRRLYVILLFVFLVLGCHDKIGEEEGKPAWLSIEFLTDKSVETRAGDEMLYNLKIEKLDGTPVCSFEDCSTISERILLHAGIYRLVASSGEDVETGFDVPFYQTQQEINLQGGENKQIALTCSQANVKVSVKYSEAVRKHFSGYTFTVNNGNGKLEFGKDEERAGYLRVNEGILEWKLDLNNGQETYQLSKRITDVKARQHYNFAFDVSEDGSEGDGAWTGGIVVDTTLDVFNWECNIVLKEKTAKPVLRRGDGGAFDEPCLVLAETRGANIICDVEAEAGVSDLVIRHRSEELKRRGIPESFSLTNMSTEVQEAVNAAGIVWLPLSPAGAQQATLDFSDLANRLPLGDYKFCIGVYDTRFRFVSDTLRISVIPDIDHIADEVNVMDVWAKFATLRGRWYTAVRPEGIGLEYSIDRNTWMPATALTFNESSKTFSASVAALEPATTYYYRTTSAEKGASETVREFSTEAADQVLYSNFDSWYADGKAPMVGIGGEQVIWDSGNKGGASFGVIPTLEASGQEAVSGSAVKMICKYVAGKFAAGNIYTGEYGGKDGLTDVFLNFGTPYTCRPTSLSGYFKYTPGTINHSKAPYSHLEGKSDTCCIYVVLTDWDVPFRARSKDLYYPDYMTDPGVIAYGAMSTAEHVSEYRRFTIPIKYRDTTRKPKHIVIVATACKYGDYFTGSENSVMYVDEFELGFDPVE